MNHQSSIAMSKSLALAARAIRGCIALPSVGCRVQGAGCRVQGAGCRVQGSGCWCYGAVRVSPNPGPCGWWSWSWVVVVVVVVEAPDQGRRQHVGGLPAAARAAEAAVRLASQLGVVPHAPRRQPQGRARGKRACGGSGLAATPYIRAATTAIRAATQHRIQLQPNIIRLQSHASEGEGGAPKSSSLKKSRSYRATMTRSCGCGCLAASARPRFIERC